MESRIAEVTGSDDGKLDRGVSDLDDGKPESSESTEGVLNPIIKPGGKYSYLRVSCYFDVNYVKHNLHQSEGKLLTLDFCPLKIADDDQCSTLEISKILLEIGRAHV